MKVYLGTYCLFQIGGGLAAGGRQSLAVAEVNDGDKQSRQCSIAHCFLVQSGHCCFSAATGSKCRVFKQSSLHLQTIG